MQNRSNVSLTPELLRELANAESPCITVAVQRGGNARARLKDAMRQIETELKAQVPSLDDKVFAPLRSRMEELDPDLSKHSLIVLSSPSGHHLFESERPVQEIVSVDDQFHLRPLLSLLNDRADFYILALSQKHTRLLHCTESASGEVALPPGTPASYDDSRQTRKPDHDLENRSSAGPGHGQMGGVLSGSSSDADNKYEYLLDFFHAVNQAVRHVLNGTNAPLVVVGVEHELALYAQANTYPGIVEPGVHGSPDGLKGGEMHRRALELLQSQPSPEVRRVLEHFDKQAGTGHASNHAQEIVKAAFEGRVSHLLLQETAEYLGTFDEMRQKVKRHDDGIAPMRDLLNEAVVQTLRHGGQVAVLTPKQIPNGIPVCAIFRYPSPELQAAMRTKTAGSVEPV
jgi:hypothetical protein